MTVASLAHFLKATEAQFQVFDVSLALKKCDHRLLTIIDDGQPYPMPYMGFAWVVVFLWNPTQPQANSFWFFKLPVDEQGICSRAAHNDLVQRLYKSLKTSDADERSKLINEHPYQFTPPVQTMAALHAHTSNSVRLPPSQFWPTAHAFFNEPNRDKALHELGIQGIADFVARTSEQGLTDFAPKLAHLPLDDLLALLAQYEHRTLPTATLSALLARMEAEPDNSMLMNAVLRAVAQSTAVMLFDECIKTNFQSGNITLETLLVLFTRYTHLLTNDDFAMQLVDLLTQKADADGVNRVLTNAALQAPLRTLIPRLLGHSSLTPNVANALTALIQQARRPQHD